MDATRNTWAICCSGGGIRSATYCLGALQSLDEGKLLSEAKWITGVSGGSYIAASRALVAYGLQNPPTGQDGQDARQDGQPTPQDSQNGQDSQEGQPTRLQGQDSQPTRQESQDSKDARHGEPTGPLPAYARGTPEETNLRYNTRYIAPDAKTVLVGVMSLVFGALVTFLLVTAPLYAFGHAWGWLLHSRGVLTTQPGGAKMSASVGALTWWLGPAIVAGIALAMFLFWWATLPTGSPGRGTDRARWVGWAAFITSLLALAMLATPPLISWLYDSTGPVGTVVHFFGFGKGQRPSIASLTALIAAVTAIAHNSQRQLDKLKAAPGAAGQSAGPLAAVWAQVQSRLMPWLASALIIVIGAAATLLWIADGAAAGYTPTQLWGVLAALAVMAGTRVAADINRTSLHDFYRWRLSDAYAVTRAAAQATGSERRKFFAKAARTRLSQLADVPGPKLVICTTANINANGEVAAGRGGFCLAFDPEKVTLRCGALSDEPQAEVKTADYEHLLGHTRFTLFDVVAISGAAFSPLMGAATRSAYRILLTLTNLRLGVWLPHPAVIRAAAAHRDKHAPTGGQESPTAAARLMLASEDDRWWTRRPSLLLLWYACPHWRWRRDTKNPRTRDHRETRLWAYVLELREKSDHRAWPYRLWAAVCWRAMQPTFGMLWAEAAGHTDYRATWINVTDGGHYDNLGLVEALRREKVDKVVVLDASGDKTDTWFTLGGAVALARVDAGVEIDLNPTTMVQPGGSLGPGEVVRPWARGTFTRLGNGAAADGAQPPGDLWVCKLGWWEKVPWDVRAYAARHSTYPCDSTMQQLYDSSEFEAYHELGVSAILVAAREGGLPLRRSSAATETIEETTATPTATEEGAIKDAAA